MTRQMTEYIRRSRLLTLLLLRWQYTENGQKQKLTPLQPVIPLSAVRHQRARRPQALLAEHLVAPAGGQEEDDDRHQKHTGQHAEQPPPHRVTPDAAATAGMWRKRRRGENTALPKESSGQAGRRWEREGEERGGIKNGEVAAKCRGRGEEEARWDRGLYQRGANKKKRNA